MRAALVGFLLGSILSATLVARAGLDDSHPFHERAERFVCEHPRHAERAHGLSIMPEACDE